MITLSFLGIVQSAGIVAATGVPPAVEGSGRGDMTNSEIILDFVGTLSGSYVAGGDALDFSSAALPNDVQLESVAPSDLNIYELGIKGTALPGFTYKYVYGPTLQYPTNSGGALQIFGGATASQDGMNEIAAGVYTGTTPSLNNTQIKIRAHFAKSA